MTICNENLSFTRFVDLPTHGLKIFFMGYSSGSVGETTEYTSREERTERVTAMEKFFRKKLLSRLPRI